MRGGHSIQTLHEPIGGGQCALEVDGGWSEIEKLEAEVKRLELDLSVGGGRAGGGGGDFVSFTSTRQGGGRVGELNKKAEHHC